MKKILPLILIALTISLSSIFGQNAPISTVGNVTSSGTTLVLPIMAADFTDIGSCNMQLLYNPAIATCTGVTKGPGLPGGLDYNVTTTPGVVTFGWYTWPGVTLPDNSVIFNLSFTKVTAGTSVVSWNDSYADRQWSDGSSFPLNDLPLDTYYIDGSLTFQGNAPITIAPVIGACPGSTIAVPITVLSFNTIGVLSLTMQFNAAVLTYQSYTNTSGFPGLGVLNPNVGNITVAGFVPTSSPGVTLPDNAVLVTLYFTYLGGTTDLTWFDNGESCEYGGPPVSYPVLNDIPASTYYIPGQVSELCNSYWTGNVDDDWFNAGNWTNGVPNSIKDAVIPVVDPNPYPLIDAAADCKQADIATGAALTVGIDGSLTSHNTFNNNGDFTVKSSPTDDGSFIDNGSITGTGSFSVERYIDEMKWHYVSSPIADGLSMIYYHIYLKSFSEETGAWTYIAPVDIPLIPMKGYAAWASTALTGSKTVYYTGNLNTGTFTTELTHHAEALHNYKGFNFIGNPYPSAIDWDQSSGWSKTNVDNAIYFWNPLIGQYGSYVTYPPTGTNGATNIIPSGQGFMVHVTNGQATGSISVNNNARLHDDKQFLKGITAESEIPLLRLKTTSGMNAYSDETIIRFTEAASVDFDSESDAYKMNGLEEAPQIYTVSIDQTRLSINTSPILTANTIFPIGFETGTNGIYTIEVTDLSNFDPDIQIILEDKENQLFVNLGEQLAYSFFASVLDEPNRFNLHFSFDSFGVDDLLANNKVQIYGNGNYIYLVNPTPEFISGKVEVYDVLGRQVNEVEVSGINRVKLYVEGNGTYIVTYYDDLRGEIDRKKVQLY